MEENRRRWSANRRSSRVRREVPVVGGENTIEWINISAPSPSDDKRSVVLPSPEENYASSSRVIFRLENQPSKPKRSRASADLFYGSTSAPLVFYPYALTSSGVVYALNISNVLAYESGSVIPPDHFIHVDVRPYLNEAQVTSIAWFPFPW
ncbi:hypothetical protein DY000_02034600 [Brassica cretica]|uniref:Uncharacterized protein n=1 Tax=Brassica cretica TaxID=69181 RepID=A0ABQ7DGB9_BRACR|nr:hypothetical protein DY000_02034600 [Brassica cretica]